MRSMLLLLANTYDFFFTLTVTIKKCQFLKEEKHLSLIRLSGTRAFLSSVLIFKHETLSYVDIVSSFFLDCKKM